MPQSSKITRSTQHGLMPFQTWETPENLAALASSWAALLPLLFKFLKENQENEQEMSLTFWMMCPISPPRTPSLVAWTVERVSDSKMAWEIPISNASSTPSCSAIAFVISAEKGTGRILLKAAMGEPRQLRIITPMLEGLPSSEAASLTLTLKKPEGGTVQIVGVGARESREGTCILIFTKNSVCHFPYLTWRGTRVLI